jgi:hypothetical protein
LLCKIAQGEALLTKYQIVTIVPLVVDVALPTLLIGFVIALGRLTARRTLIALAVTAMTLVLVGMALLEVVTGLHGPLLNSAGDPYSRQRLAVLMSELIESMGFSLSFAAVILGLREAARLSYWGWFIALLLTQMGSTLGATLFQYPYVSALFNQMFYDQLYRGDLTVSVPYYLFTSLLLIAAPLGTLLFAIFGLPGEETPNPIGPARPAPLPPAAPSSAPNQPYTSYPPHQ